VGLKKLYLILKYPQNTKTVMVPDMFTRCQIYTIYFEESCIIVSLTEGWFSQNVLSSTELFYYDMIMFLCCRHGESAVWVFFSSMLPSPIETMAALCIPGRPMQVKLAIVQNVLFSVSEHDFSRMSSCWPIADPLCFHHHSYQWSYELCSSPGVRIEKTCSGSF